MQDNHEKQIRVTHYVLWFLLNIFLGIIPFVTPFFSPLRDVNQLFSSFIAYAFTLIIINAYLFDTFVRTSNEIVKFERIWFWFAVIISFILIIFFVLFNVLMLVWNFPQALVLWASFFLFVFTIGYTFLLNKPLIQRDIKNEINKSIIKEVEDINNNMSAMKKKIMEKGTW